MNILNKYTAGGTIIYIESPTREKPNTGSLKSVEWEWNGVANLKQNVAKAIEGLSFSKEEKEAPAEEPAEEPKQEEPKKATLAETVRLLASVLPSETK
jgi:hypothetical protein